MTIPNGANPSEFASSALHSSTQDRRSVGKQAPNTAAGLSISQDFFGRIAAAGAEDAAAGMAGGAAEIEAADGRAMVGPAGNWPHEGRQ